MATPLLIGKLNHTIKIKRKSNSDNKTKTLTTKTASRIDTGIRIYKDARLDKTGKANTSIDS